ncbi:MAG: malto-oligosyltrehalose synthase, partial [Porticoccaceae bacterium]
MTTSTTPEMPRATARLQLHRGFTFDDAVAQLPYLAQLGISHIYTSPILTARAGSLHGYDVIDHGTVSAELGGEDGLRRLVSGLREHGMGVVVDIVPNHMAVGRSDNRLWLDVLEWGRASRYAEFFDIDWDVPDPDLNQRVLAPFLGKPYGKALIDGELILCFDREDGRFFAQYFGHRFPLAPQVYAPLLRAGAAPLAKFSQSFRDAAKFKLNTRGGTFELARAEFAGAVGADPTVAAALDELLARFNPASIEGRDRLHRLLERCHFRLAWWRAAADEINWRRFFDVIELAGVRVERPATFEIVHATTLRLYAEGLIDGVRIDHIDGLADPRTYCRRLRKRLAELAHLRPANAPKGRAYLVVEKILAHNEPLARDWQTDGTTGYSFMNDVGALLHDPGGETSLTDLWVRFSGRWPDFRDEELRARRRIPLELLAADFNGCARALHRIARSDPLTRDWSLGAVQRILSEILVYFPVYRTYADARGRSDEDTALMARVVADVRARCRPAELSLLELIDGWLGGQPPNRCGGSAARQLRLYAIARFQQLTSPVAAKSVEDTAFYRHGRLLSRSEVGSDPGRFSLSMREFHLKAGSRTRHFPHALLATATHDHKRGEDLRARLAVLSEVTERWGELVQWWRARNARFKTVLAGTEVARTAITDAGAADQGAPDGADEYMLYQMIVGAWPHGLAVTDADGIAELRDRLQGWML